MLIGERAQRVVIIAASGGRFGIYQSHTKFITLVGELVVILYQQKQTSRGGRLYKTIYVIVVEWIEICWAYPMELSESSKGMGLL